MIITVLKFVGLTVLFCFVLFLKKNKTVHRISFVVRQFWQFYDNKILKAIKIESTVCGVTSFLFSLPFFTFNSN